MHITKPINIEKKNLKNKQLVVNHKQYNLDHCTHARNVDAVADITKLLQLLPDQNT